MSLENTNEYFKLFYTNSGQNKRYVHRNVSKDIAGCSNNYYHFYYMYMFQNDDSAWNGHIINYQKFYTAFISPSYI